MPNEPKLTPAWQSTVLVNLVGFAGAHGSLPSNDLSRLNISPAVDKKQRAYTWFFSPVRIRTIDGANPSFVSPSKSCFSDVLHSERCITKLQNRLRAVWETLLLSFSLDTDINSANVLRLGKRFLCANKGFSEHGIPTAQNCGGRLVAPRGHRQPQTDSNQLLA